MTKIVKFALLTVLALAIGCASARGPKKTVPTFEIAKTCTAINNGYFQDAKTSFSSDRDKRVYAFARILYVREPHKVVFRWFGPNGLYHESPPVMLIEKSEYHHYVSIYQMLDISEFSKLGLQGQWRVEIQLDGESAGVLPFTIGS